MNTQTDCEFSVPINIGNEAKPDYEYSILTCRATTTNGFTITTTDETLELIENPTTGASFFISKQISYGDILVGAFLMLFLIFGILKFFSDFFIPKEIKRFP